MAVPPVPDTGVVTFYARGEDTLLFWMDAHTPQPRIERAAVSSAEIAAVAGPAPAVRPGEYQLSTPSTTTDLSQFHTIGERLLTPVADAVAGVGRLVVAAHGELHGLPLHAIALSGGKPLGTTHSVTYVPNLSLYASLVERAPDRGTFVLPSLCLATAADDDAESVARELSAGAAQRG